MRKIIVGALFDDANGSVSKALENHYQYKVYSFGISNNRNIDNFQYIDISLTNTDLIKYFKRQPEPDIIVASPPCKSGSIADHNGRMVRYIGVNSLGYIRNNRYYEEYNKKCAPSNRRKFINKERLRINGENTAGATMKLIQHFKPKHGYIENPQTSKMGEFIDNHGNFHGYKSLAYYNNYDSERTRKATIFFSNQPLTLKKDSKVISTSKGDDTRDYNKRSAIPSKLLEEIFKLGK